MNRLEERWINKLKAAADSLLANKLRSGLTSLGIIFGVAAVISMLAIGTGAQRELMEQMKLVGANNLIIKSKIPESTDNQQENEKNDHKILSNGLSLSDAQSLKSIIPQIERLNPEINKEVYITLNGSRKQAMLVGINQDFFTSTPLNFSSGKAFDESRYNSGDAVCVIGNKVKQTFFAGKNAVGNYLKVGENWLLILGVLENRGVSGKDLSSLGIREMDNDVYVPIKTMLIRYQNRGLITKNMIEKMSAESEESETPKAPVNYHQLDKITIGFKPNTDMAKAAELVSSVLLRLHGNYPDFEVIVPELLIKQQQKTKEIFNFVLGAIAGISLLVGGIGIMNIMLASVLERTREIGVRRAVGATQNDIISQFLLEAILLCFGGSIVGVLLGVVLAYLIQSAAEIETVITLWSVMLSVLVSVGVGLLFGITPAKRAAALNPVEALRWE